MVTAPRRPLPRLLASLLLTVTLLARLLVPTGFMVAPATAGATPMIVICSGSGPMTMAAPEALRPHGGDDHNGKHDGKAGEHPCAFAVASAAADLAALSHPVPPASQASDAIGADPLAPRPGLGLAAPPPPKTGPPVLR